MPAQTLSQPVPQTGTQITNVGLRFRSLDVYRGLTVAGMMLVTNPGTYSHVFPQLLHAEWNGMTATDLIAPSFLFLVGYGWALSAARRAREGATRLALAGHLLLRAGLLFALGLLLNAVPDFNLHYLRVPGILQHIAMCMVLGGLLHLVTGREVEGSLRPRPWLLLTATAGLMLTNVWLMFHLRVPGYGAGHLDPFGQAGGWVDRSVFGTNHLWPWGSYWWDPDGLFNTLAACGNVTLGIGCAEWLRRANRAVVLRMVAAGVAMIAAGWLLDPMLPVNKKLWTDSYVLVAGGWCLLIMTALHVGLDRRSPGRLLSWMMRPANILGRNAIAAFALTTVANAYAGRIHVAGHPLPEAVYLGAATWLPLQLASLDYALLYVVVLTLVVRELDRRGIYLKL